LAARSRRPVRRRFARSLSAQPPRPAHQPATPAAASVRPRKGIDAAPTAASPKQGMEPVGGRPARRAAWRPALTASPADSVGFQ